MLADIASGETDTADIFFLLALVFAALAAVLAGVRRADAKPWSPVAGWAAVALLAFAWLVL